MTGIIYRATNKINGKIYIGQTWQSLSERICKHLRSAHGVFPFALRKYGFNSFEFNVIDSADSKKILDEKETYWINFFNSLVPLGYNLDPIGHSKVNSKHSEETRKKLSETHKGKQQSEETKNKRRQKLIGKNRPQEVKDKIRAGHFRNPYIRSEATRSKMSKAHKGRYLSEQTKRKIGNAIRGRESRLKGTTRPEEFKKKIGLSVKAHWEKIKQTKFTNFGQIAEA